MEPKKTKKSQQRYRNWTTVVYPESAPEDWLSIIESEMVEVFVSPLHKDDIDPTGEKKKPHFHVLIMYDGVKTFEQAHDFVSRFGGVGCLTVASMRGCARYLCHLDNPDKAQYSVDDVISFAGADYVGIIGLSIDRYKAISDMMAFCDDNHIQCFCDLITYARNDNFGWFRILCDNGAYIMKEYLKSRVEKMFVKNKTDKT